MNKIPCVIEKIINDGSIAFIKLAFKQYILSSMLLDGDRHQMVGQEVFAVFKETEVMVCDKDYSKISARNLFVSEVIFFESSLAVSRVIFDFEGIEISSLISKEAFMQLEIDVGKKFAWFVKSSEVMLVYV